MKKRIFAALLSLVMIAGIIVPLAPKAKAVDIEEHWTLGVDMWGFNSWADYYKADGVNNTAADKLREVEDVLAAGYLNHMMVSYDENFTKVLALCKKYDVDVWIGAGFFNSKKQSIEDFMLNNEEKVNDIIEAGMWDNFLGFYWDEPFLNGMTNADFYLMTKSLFEKWGKRNYPVFAQNHFLDKVTLTDKNKEKIQPYSLEYITDVSWDNYSYDMREEAKSNPSQNNALKNNSKTLGVEFETAEDYYRFIHSQIMDKIDHDVYVWFHPCAYESSVWTGGYADEGYCIGHLEFFLKLLNEQEHPGGITLYSYASWSTPGIEQYLEVPNIQTGKQLLYPEVSKWKEYSQDLRDMVMDFRTRKLTTITDGPFGHLNVMAKNDNSITIQAEKGYTYSLDGGAFKSTSKFTGLKADTTYTITVKRTSDGRTKSFSVKTDKKGGAYSTGLNDTASYIMKIPSSYGVYTGTYGSISANISRNLYDTDYHKNSNGDYAANGYIHIKETNGERFLEINNNGKGTANTNISLYFGDERRSSYDKGLSEGVYTNKLSAFAIRTKIKGASRSSQMVVDATIGGVRPRNADENPILFVNKSTGKITELEYSGGINLKGNIDGWIIIPFDAYNDLDDNESTTNLDYIKNNIKSIQLYQNSEDWEDIKWYVGDMFVLENVEAFATAQTGKTATVQPESSSNPASDNNDNNNNNDTSSQKPSDDSDSSKVEADDNVSSTQSDNTQSDNAQGDDDQNGGGKVEYEYYIPDYVWYIVAAGAAVVIAVIVITIVVVRKKRAKAVNAVAVFGDDIETESVPETEQKDESEAETTAE